MEIKLTDGFKQDMVRLFSSQWRYAVPRWLDNTKYEIKWAWQRVFRGWDDRITWSIDGWMNENMPEIIRKMCSFAHGVPANIDSSKEWKNILEKIATGFDSARQLSESAYMKKVPIKKPIKMFGILRNYKYEVDEKKLKKLEDNFDYGMKLFCRYYHNLWD